jgi:hypothetical protein
LSDFAQLIVAYLLWEQRSRAIIIDPPTLAMFMRLILADKISTADI